MLKYLLAIAGAASLAAAAHAQPGGLRIDYDIYERDVLVSSPSIIIDSAREGRLEISLQDGPQPTADNTRTFNL